LPKLVGLIRVVFNQGIEIERLAGLQFLGGLLDQIGKHRVGDNAQLGGDENVVRLQRCKTFLSGRATSSLSMPAANWMSSAKGRYLMTLTYRAA